MLLTPDDYYCDLYMVGGEMNRDIQDQVQHGFILKLILEISLKQALLMKILIKFVLNFLLINDFRKENSCQL